MPKRDFNKVALQHKTFRGNTKNCENKNLT